MAMTAVAAIVADRLGVLGPSWRRLAIVLFVIGLAIYFSASRTAIAMFVMLLVLSIAFARPQERRVVFTAYLVTVLGVVLAAIAIANIPVVGGAHGDGYIQIRTSVLDPISDPDRWQTFVDGWSLWLQSPIFGSGLGAYIEYQDTDRILVFHSVPLWMMAEMGFVGLAVGLAAFGCLALGAIRLTCNPHSRVWGIGLLMAWTCWGAGNLLHDFALQRSLWFLVALAFGVMPSADGAKPWHAEHDS